MIGSVDAAKKLIKECSKEEQLVLKEFISSLVPHPLELDWGVDADTILGQYEALLT